MWADIFSIHYIDAIVQDYCVYNVLIYLWQINDDEDG